MIAGIGTAKQMQITINDDHFSFAWAAKKAKPCRCLAFIHFAICGQRMIFAMLDKWLVEHAAIGKKAAHNQAIIN